MKVKKFRNGGKQNMTKRVWRVSRLNSYDQNDQSEVNRIENIIFLGTRLSLYIRACLYYICIYVYIISTLSNVTLVRSKTRNGITNWPTRHANKRRAVEKLKQGWRGKKNGQGGGWGRSGATSRQVSGSRSKNDSLRFTRARSYAQPRRPPAF